MRRVYKLPGFDHVTNGTCEGLLTNGFGSYFAMSPQLSYQGWYQLFPKEWRMQKIIESITPLDEGDTTALYHQFYGLRRLFQSGAEDTIIPYHNVLLYSTKDVQGRVRVTFDHRESYEPSSMGRYYTIETIDNGVVISFMKKNEEGKIIFEHFVTIKGIQSSEIINQWREVEYEYDKKRNAQSTYWVYDALSFISHVHVVFASGKTKSESRVLADIAASHFDDILSNVHERSLEQTTNFSTVPQPELRAAASSAAWSLQSLQQNFAFDHRMVSGIYAGLPWFFQIWSRDELISLGGLISLAKRNNDQDTFFSIKEILERHIKNILPSGLLANRYPSSQLGSIDAVGWLAKRTKNFIEVLKREKQLYTILSLEDLLFWYKTFSQTLTRVKETRMKDGLFTNEYNETWMDTSYHDDGREGVRVEIQALFYALYDVVVYLGKLLRKREAQKLRREQSQFRKKFREVFLQKNYAGLLLDGINKEGLQDRTARPNVFLAMYVAPTLLSKKEWVQVTDYLLRTCYVYWGGFATIQQDNSLFQPTCTGQNNKSYHRGDVWYFVNNLAACALLELDKEKYHQVILRIAFAGAKDILELGFAGHGSEISSAAIQEAQGCFAQAWSVATYVELVDLLYPIDFIF